MLITFEEMCKQHCNFSYCSSANATPEFEGRGGEELAVEISNMLTRAYDCPSCLDLHKLCVVPGQQCWVLYVDVLVGTIYRESSKIGTHQ